MTTTRKKTKKIGVWYVCRRCCEPFDTPSAIERHQSRKQLCKPSKTPGASNMHLVRYRKALEDFGNDAETYLRHVIQRGVHWEIIDVLDSCDFQDFNLFLKLLTNLDGSSEFFDLLALLSDYSNRNYISLERRMRLKAYVDEHITL